ncbi:MAG: hypothetical protein WCN98_13055, partial [Verrucomicrobiaceae bacterium]
MASVADCEEPSLKLADRADYQAALRALDEKLPQVAALKYERMLQDKTLTRTDASKLGARLADSLTRSGQAGKLLITLDLFEIPEAQFWKSQALLLQGKYREAEGALREYLAGVAPAYESLARLALGKVLIAEGREGTGRKEFRDLVENCDPVIARQAQLWMAESEVISGRSEVVLHRLENSDRDDAQMEFIRADALIQKGDGRSAELILRKMLGDDHKLSHRLHDGVVVRLAQAFEAQGRLRAAEKLLQRFIKETETSPFFDQAFAALDRVKSAEEGDTVTKFANMAAAKDASERRA